MLSWLSSGPQPDSNTHDVDASSFQDHPDTPAHVFAARAFKYRLWGTPKPGVDQLRPNAIARSNINRPHIPQSKSEEFLASPSRPNGILLTPGTSNLKRYKTVTFDKEGGVAEEQQERRKSIAGVPGKFPSPAKVDVQGLDSLDHPRRPSAFTERLQSAKSTPSSTQAPVKAIDQAPIAKLAIESQKTTETIPISTSTNIDWKERYEQYVARTEKEMRKLIAKQQAAKHYARDKDAKAIGLAEQLRTEHQRVTQLETQVNDLMDQLSRLNANLRTTDTSERKTSVPSPTLEQRFSAIRARSVTSPSKSPSRVPEITVKPTGPRSALDSDIWAGAAVISPSTPRRPVGSKDNISTPRTSYLAPLQPRDMNAESHTPLTTPPRVSVRAGEAPRYDLGRAEASRRSEEQRVTPGRRMRREMQTGGKENAAPLTAVEGESPRKTLDAERRAKAAARIAARRMERERKSRVGV